MNRIKLNGIANMLDYKQASERTGLPIGTLRAHVCNGTIPHHRMGPRTVRFNVHQLDAWIAKHAVVTL